MSSKLTPNQRRLASIDLTLTYFQSYFEDWRLVNVLAIERMLNDRYNFFSDIVDDVKKPDDSTGQATIAQEIKHGLHFSAIAQCVQYIEDLFALIRASKNPDYFVKSIVTYKAGDVTGKIKGFSTNREAIFKTFFVPDELVMVNEEMESVVNHGIDELQSLIVSLKDFYAEYEFFYNQYKHGLCVAMRTFGNVFSPEQVELDKNGDNPPFLAVYDNMNLHAAAQRGTFNSSMGVFMPGFTDNVRPHIAALSSENNFLRLVITKNHRLPISDLVEIARKTRMCIKVFIYNYSRFLVKKDGIKEFALPCDYRDNTTYQLQYTHDTEQ